MFKEKFEPESPVEEEKTQEIEKEKRDMGPEEVAEFGADLEEYIEQMKKIFAEIKEKLEKAETDEEKEGLQKELEKIEWQMSEIPEAEEWAEEAKEGEITEPKIDK